LVRSGVLDETVLRLLWTSGGSLLLTTRKGLTGATYDELNRLFASLRLDHMTLAQVKKLREIFFSLAVDLYNGHLLVEKMQRDTESELASRGVDWAKAICQYQKDIEEQRRRRDEAHPVYY
jgi:hypothetical protein